MISRVEAAPNGFQLSEFIQGYWRLADWQMSPVQRLDFLKQHLELGITSIDHADIYGNYSCEQLFGEALALEPALRQQLEIVSKCDIKLLSDKYPQRTVKHYDTSAAHIVASVEASLTHLGTDYLDLLLIHRPDPLMNADEVAEAFTRLQASGKVRHFGVSNFTPYQFDLLQSRLDFSLVTNQVEVNPINLFALHDGTLDQMQMKRIRPMIWSALGGGAIFTSQTEQAHRLRTVLSNISEELGGAGLDQVIYAWLLKLPCQPLPIIGSGNIDRVRAAVAAKELSLTREQWFQIWEASQGHEVA
ncbi:aldo/keto reductase [Tolumonas lignilytica]|uniref:aldo/keto reductase n=1 Tax=Tolumonas lignilytica TaxID=1283284 RepID=UPI0004648B58|nr:aldo/keto reductase family oxidoreductase [Tolumonas lignilytica]